MNTEPTVESTNNRITLVSFMILLILMMVLCFWLLSPFLLSIVMGGIISLMLKPLYRKLLKNLGPKMSSLLLTLGVVLLLILPLTLLAVLAVKQAVTIGHAVSEDPNLTPQAIFARLNEWPPIKSFFGDAGAFEEKAGQWLEASLKSISGSLLLVFSGIPSTILSLVLAAISCFVFLLDGERFVKWMSNKLPLEYEVQKKLSISFRDTAVSTIWATLGAGGAQSAVMFVAFLVLGVPAVFLATGLTFIFAWIPMVGCSPIWIVGAIYLISEGQTGKAIVMVVFGLGAGIVDNIVRPMILQGRSKMHPMIGLISIFGGIGLFGIVGVFIGPVLASLMIALLSLWSEIGTRYGLLPKE